MLSGNLLLFSKAYVIIWEMLTENRPIAEMQAKQMNPVVLAFVGDAVYTLLVRERLALSSGEKTGALNKKTSMLVSARGQSGLLEKILPLLTEAETEIYHRGRNAKKPTKSKNAGVGEYVRSTGFEAVIGYLYLTGQTKRIEELTFTGNYENRGT